MGYSLKRTGYSQIISFIERSNYYNPCQQAKGGELQASDTRNLLSPRQTPSIQLRDGWLFLAIQIGQIRTQRSRAEEGRGGAARAGKRLQGMRVGRSEKRILERDGGEVGEDSWLIGDYA